MSKKYVPVKIKKPSLMTIVENVWGQKIPVPAHQGDMGLHSAMAEWADSKTIGTVLIVKTAYDDGSKDEVEIPHATKTVQYKCYDGEIYEIEHEISKWDISDDLVYYENPLSKRGVLKAYTDWHNEINSGGVKITLEIKEV